jgi:hypothetical protein
MSGPDQKPLLPFEVVELLGGKDLRAALGFTVQLLTVDPAGWPRSALLSAGEVLILDQQTVHLALWRGTHSVANLRRERRAALAFVLAGAAYTALIETSCSGELEQARKLIAFQARVVEVRGDQVDYARLNSGITFDLVDQDAVVERWRSTIAQLRRLSVCGDERVRGSSPDEPQALGPG